ncbi:hypothetical protein MLD38_038827 [Melastoma candidum]|uniref:Uncharacterized protein n=1 Tax=Melastoma candidum TaxID=119954 RepID=A0ACB9L0U6_9MYRT|nr:hypothetical protein MLD38_038827 [Melastoma candidum]
MGITTHYKQFTSTISPARFFKALVTDSHGLIPKAITWGIQSIEFLEGDGGLGSIEQTNLVDGYHSGKLKYVKHRVDVMDVENLRCKYTLIECDVDFEKLDSVSYDFKFEATPGGGSVCRMTRIYHVKAGCHLTGEELKEGKLSVYTLFKAVEKYLIAHPGECA